MKQQMAVNRFGFFVLGMIGMLLLCSAAHAQVASSGQQAPYTNTVVMPDHAAHATQTEMRAEQSLLGSNGVTTAHGERPLWEFADNTPVKPLGDVAREYRTEHAKVEKAIRVWVQ